MRTFRTTKFSLPLLTFILALFISSCATDTDALKSQEVIERIDLKMEGSQEEYIYLEAENNDIVSSKKNLNSMEFILQLDETRMLKLNVINNIEDNIWLNTESGYSLVPNQNIDDKRRYVEAELILTGETSYTSNQGENFPQSTYINVFKIEEFNPATNEVLCKITDFPLVNISSPDEITTLTGTFRGSLDFLN